ncbi:MAG: patatin-like phospholipase family protein, partial [Rubrobacteraceae bacterium]|nr:patatin-like phospholipase family protein [Rubrobacteraceae bacterium]
LGEPPLVPALSYILLLAMLLCWILSGLAFFLDRYRIPLLIPLVLWLGLNAYLPWSEYYYPVQDPLQEAGSASSDSEGRIGADSDGKIIVVASNGGGIQAAAWTARVLTGLEEECRTKCKGSFDQSVHLISSVSGGSIGTMYFVNEYEGGRLPRDPAELEEIVDRTEGSSLDEVSWGVLYPDLIRTFFPNPWVLNGWDRGRALEQAWLRRDLDTSWANRKRVEQGLLKWRRNAEDSNRPAVIFNTAVVETGQRLPLATTALPQDSPGDLSYNQYFKNVDPKPDIPVVTAARLSASFPYVAPAARAAVEAKTGHLVDGGYYDNYGISSLVEWLDAELEDNPNIKEVLIVELRGAPSGPGGPRTDTPECRTEPVVVQDPESTWFSQILAPPQGALSVRNTGQRTHNDVELDLLQDKWSREADAKEHKGHVEITRALFEFDGENPPLSWHLTNDQKDKIEQEWREEVDDPSDSCAGWDRVQTFLGPKGK